MEIYQGRTRVRPARYFWRWRVTLQEAQQAFRQSPNQSTALAYLDAAILASEGSSTAECAAELLAEACQAIRDWLAIPQVPA